MAEAIDYECTSSLLIPIDELLGGKVVEKQRLEFKKAWDNDKTPNRGTYWQVVHTITAFANDYFNENGGYLVIGVEEFGKKPSKEWKVCGIDKTSLDNAQIQIKGACKANIRPTYTPIVSPEIYESKHVLVIWAQAGDEIPYQCRVGENGAKDATFKYYIRQGPETVVADKRQVETLLMRTNKKPYDDRMARDADSGKPADLKDISHEIFSEFLTAVGSKLLRVRDEPFLNLYKNYKLVTAYGDTRAPWGQGVLVQRFVPRNFALMFFNKMPQNFFRGAKIEVAWYKAKSKSVIREKTFEGPIHQQIRNCRDLILEATQEEVSSRCTSYPQQALTEALVNAVYHRGYEPQYPDPVKVHVSPDGIKIISYPGPADAMLKQEHFQEGGMNIPLVPARNRRIGELLKELKLAEMRGAGVPAIYDAMEGNQNPPPRFSFSDTCFQVTLPSHPVYQTQVMIAEVDKMVAKGETQKAFDVLLAFIEETGPSVSSERIVLKILKHFNSEQYIKDPRIVSVLVESGLQDKVKKCQPLLREIRIWKENPYNDIENGIVLIKELVKSGGKLLVQEEVVDIVLRLCHKDVRSLENFQAAHRLFDAMGPTILQENARLAFEYARCKFQIFFLNKDKIESASQLDYLESVTNYANIALQLTPEAEAGYLANQYRLLGDTNYWLIAHNKSTPAEVSEYHRKAKGYNPDIRINPMYNDPQGLVDRMKAKENVRQKTVQKTTEAVPNRPVGRGRGRHFK